MSRRTYLSIAAQESNLGDVLLRRTIAKWGAERSGSLMIYTGSMSAGYIDACHLDPRAVVTSSRIRYQVSMLIAAIGGRADLIMSPGPFVLSTSSTMVMKSFAVACMLTLIRATGGSVFAVGRGLEGPGRWAARIERWATRSHTVSAVRDSRSAAIAGTNSARLPDLAMHTTASSNLPRGAERVLISLRFDRRVDEAGLARAIEWIRSRGAEVAFVSQVRNDDEIHQRLARTTGSPVHLWGNATHEQQMRAIVGLYSGAFAVLSNRLHVVLLGAQYGALGVGMFDHESGKLPTTLSGMLDVPLIPAGSIGVDVVREALGDLDLDVGVARRAKQYRQLSLCDEQLASVEQAVARS